MSSLGGSARQSCSGPLNVVLRPMTMADLDEVVELEHRVFEAEAWTRQMLAGELEQQPASRYYVVADHNGRVAGYAGLLAAGWQADVVTIAVAADRWGQGIGSALLEALLDEAARRGCREVFLEVRTDNRRAQELYRRHWFTEIGIRKGYYQPSGADALVMRRSLADADSERSRGSAPRAGSAGGSGGSAPRAGSAGGSGGSSHRAGSAGGSGGSPPRASREAR
jgi:[ribosomal protein S18]-alanine N-acetyltransferase